MKALEKLSYFEFKDQCLFCLENKLKHILGLVTAD